MKLYLGFALVWAFLNASAPSLVPDLLGSVVTNLPGSTVNVVSQTAETVVSVVNGTTIVVVNATTGIVISVVNYVGTPAWEVVSNAAHIACILFAQSVESHPIKQPQIENVSFILMTPCGSKEFPVSEAAKFRNASEFDVKRKTIVFVTGWNSTPNETYVGDMAKAYNCRGDHNYIIVNTGGYLTNLYINAAYLTSKLGEFVAKGLQNLGIPVENIHLMGHSLGAQVVGSAGRHYFALTGIKLDLITALDPARPCFTEPVVFPCVGVGDAVVVIVIHSNPKDLGIEAQLGDIDFFPGGSDTIKPGCTAASFSCSHVRSIYYDIESVYHGNEYNFMGVHCASYSDMEHKSCVGATNPMGYATDLTAKGIYYLEVRAESLYGMNATANSTLPSGECGRCPN